MTSKLQRSIFLHIPKTGGKKVKKLLRDFTPNHTSIGDPIYDAHVIPEPERDFIYFCFVRHPAHFAHSLWNHRSRKKANTRGKSWNWQDTSRLEIECRSSMYAEFMGKIVDRPGIIEEYFDIYIQSNRNMLVGRQEHLTEDLISILLACQEDHDARGMRRDKTIVGVNLGDHRVSNYWINTMEKSEQNLMERYYAVRHII